VLEVVTWCARVGNKSLKICNDIHANGRLVAKGSTVNVGFDPVTRRSAPLPGGWVASDAP
jgi:acyl-CoA thioesterase FadM